MEDFEKWLSERVNQDDPDSWLIFGFIRNEFVISTMDSEIVVRGSTLQNACADFDKEVAKLNL